VVTGAGDSALGKRDRQPSLGAYPTVVRSTCRSSRTRSHKRDPLHRDPGKVHLRLQSTARYFVHREARLSQAWKVLFSSVST
jgi:hypothetical protein